MIKKIKFFIEVNGHQIRSLEELEANFHLQDVLELHRAGVLSRWLAAHGFDRKHEELAAIPLSSDADVLADMENAEKLIQVFCPNFSKESRSEALSYLLFCKERTAKLERLNELAMKMDSVINEYHLGYENLKAAIVDNALNFPFLAQSAISLAKHYWQLVELEFDTFYRQMLEKAPGIFFPLMALGKISYEKEKCIIVYAELVKHIASCAAEKDDQKIQRAILQGSASREQADADKYNFGSLSIVRKLTHESWDDIVPDISKRIMVIYVHQGNFVRSREEREEINSKNANLFFPVLKGLDYKGLGSSPRPLIYLDVTLLHNDEAYVTPPRSDEAEKKAGS